MQKIQSCLWFDHNAEDAVAFYTSVFRNSQTNKIAYYGKHSAEASGQKAGSVLTVDFVLENLPLMALNGGPQFKFSPALSFYVSCETEREVEDYWRKLRAGGNELMELKQYPWAEKYGWCTDKFGVSWQIILTKDSTEDTQKIAPALLFANDLFGKGEEALNFYTSIIPNSEVEYIARDPESSAIMYAEFLLNGQKFVLMESGHKHEHNVNPAMSFVVNCDNQQEIDYYWNKLSEGGKPGQCGWLDDKYGIAWQVVPTRLADMVSGDPKKADHVMEALLKMKKLDIEELENSYH